MLLVRRKILPFVNWIKCRFNRTFKRPQAAILRLAFEEDLDRIVTFVEEARADDARAGDARTQTLGFREKEEYAKAIEESTSYIIEVDGKIIAVACIFEFKEYKPSAFELGSLLVALVMPLGMAAVVRALDEKAEIYAGAKSGSKSSKGILLAGFKRLEGEDPNLRKYCKNCHQQPEDYPKSCCVIYYQLPRGEQCRNVRNFLAGRRIITNTWADDCARLRIERITTFETSAYRKDLKEWLSKNCQDAR